MRLLARAGGGSDAGRDDSARVMTTVQHLEDLRRALTIAAAAWLLCTAASWFVSADVLRFVVHRSGLDHVV